VPLKLSKFSGPGSTPSRRRFWDNIANAVASCRKLPGKNVSVTEYDSGSLIDVNPQRANNQGGGTTGACCYSDGTCAITTADGCTGTYQGDGTVCDPNPCLQECSCGFDAFDGSGRRFLTRTFNLVVHYDHDYGGGFHRITDFTMHVVAQIDPETCTETVTCSYTMSCDDAGLCSCISSGDCDSFTGCPDCLDCSGDHWFDGIDCGVWSCSTSFTATHHEDDATYSIGADTGTATQTIDLSDECIPV